MAAENLIIVLVGGTKGTTHKQSQELEMRLKALGIGDSQIQITDNAGVLAIAAKLSVTDGTAPGEVTTKGQLDSAVSDIDGNLSAAVGYLEDADTALQGQITTLDGRADGHDASLVNLQGQITSNDGDINTLSGRIDGNDADIAAILAIAYPGFTTLTETVVGSPKTNFSLTGVVMLDANHAIDAWVDGRKQTDTVHFNRNVGSNLVIFTEAVQVTSFVEIRVYSK